MYNKLREWRNNIARSKNLSAYIVAYDVTLRDIAKQKPTKKDELIKIKGIKEAKYEQYGEAILNEVHNFLNEQQNQAPKKENKFCPLCEGSGKIHQRHGSRSNLIDCILCDGMGLK